MCRDVPCIEGNTFQPLLVKRRKASRGPRTMARTEALHWDLKGLRIAPQSSWAVQRRKSRNSDTELDFVQKSLKSTPKKIPLAATSSRACSRRKMIPRKSPIPCHRFRWNLDHPQTRHTKIYNNQLFNYPIYLPNSAGPKIRATVQPHFLRLCS